MGASQKGDPQVTMNNPSPRLLEVPVVRPFVLTGSFLFIGIFCHYLIPNFTGVRSEALAPMSLGLVVSAGYFLGWPSMLALGTNPASPWTDVMAAITEATVLYWFGVVTNMPSVTSKAPEASDHAYSPSAAR